jgi:ankyrin repeat protein
MRVMVELGAEIDRQDNDGWTALINACFDRASSCVELLLALGADVNLVANDGRTACHIAARWQQEACACVRLSLQEAILISPTTKVKLLV